MSASTRSVPSAPVSTLPPQVVQAASASFAPIPRGEKRRREIAAVAELVFFETGYADTTMQMIAARAGASKETLYRHFGSKEELFAEIVEDRAKGFLNGLDEKFDLPGSVADVLRDLGARMLQAMVDSKALSVCRLVVAESARSPELGRIFFSEGPDRVTRRLAEFLMVADARGELACADAELAAVLFIGALMSSIHLRSLILQEPPSMSAAQMEAHVEGAVEMFMARFARR